MTVLENLELGAFSPQARAERAHTRKWVHDLFPRLLDREKQKAGTLSGGEQQMLAIGRALMAKPKLLMLDEPSLGLAPLIVTELFRTIERINREGISILLVEQNVQNSLELAHKAFVMETGRVTFTGTGRELLQDANIREAYLGM
jgi:branched-chain amino acid transport system ATP-binding protein